jgi:CheY-like chemotaxis protein
LGLAIVRHLVELQGGSVKAQSEGEGKGSEFTITLPCVGVRRELSLRQQNFEANKTSLDGSPELVGLRILTVEDDPDSREMLEMILRSKGADVAAVGSVYEALQILKEKEWRPEVLVSDLGMPDEDGYDLIKKIRSMTVEEGGQVPAIALTGYAGKDEGERALRAGYQLHLTKPVDWSHLVETIAAFADGNNSGIEQ